MILFLLLNFLFVNAFTFHSKFNNWFDISNSLKNKARSYFIKNAEKKGINWNYYKNQYKKKQDDLLLIKDLTSNQYIYYPQYYKKPFHGYDKGNLNWEAAYEGVGATLSMSSNYWININPKESHSWLRGNFTNNIKKYYNATNKNFNSLDVLDLGCSVGISSEYLYKKIPNSKISGLDLSPFFIAVANFRASYQNLPINYIHHNAEYLPFKKEKYDLITSQFLFHEVPKENSVRILKESYRVLKNDSIIAIIDIDPNKLIDNPILRFFKKLLFEITEPHIHEYYKTNMTELLIEAGFNNVKKYDNNDPFNSVWVASKSNNKLKNYINNKLINQ